MSIGSTHLALHLDVSEKGCLNEPWEIAFSWDIQVGEAKAFSSSKVCIELQMVLRIVLSAWYLCNLRISQSPSEIYMMAPIKPMELFKLFRAISGMFEMVPLVE